MCKRNSRRPRMESCGTLCPINVQLERVLEWCVLLYSKSVWYLPLWYNQNSSLSIAVIAQISSLDINVSWFTKSKSFSRSQGFHSFIQKWHFLLLISSEIHTVPCMKCYYYVNVLMTLIALPFQKLWNMMLGQMLVYSWIYFFLFSLVYMGFII